MKKFILIIGGNGQDSYYLSLHLLRHGLNVHLLHRSPLIAHAKFAENKNFLATRVSSYSIENLHKLSFKHPYSHVFVIAGLVGNRLAIGDPNGVYFTNLNLGIDSLSFCQNYFSKPILVYFSTTDVMDIKSHKKPISFNPITFVSSPRTAYGKSKVCVGERILASRSKSDVRASILYFSMHESLLRTGDYILSKIKAANNCQDFPKVSLGDLNVGIDIGHAYYYMEVVAQMVLNGHLGFSDYAIGTGTSTNLFTLCESILIDKGIRICDHFIISNQSETESKYPVADVQWMNKMNYRVPKPLDATMLKSL